MHSLTSQLEYNWERGFYSVVQDSTKRYSLFTTKDEQGGIIHSPFFYLKEDCLTNLGTMGSMIDEELVKSWEWKIVDTIHPSELMGKGFQVGDKVMADGKEGTIRLTTNNNSYLVLLDGDESPDFIEYGNSDLKPVLPVEEERKKCKKCLMTFDSEKDIRPYGSEAHRNELTYVCPQCYEDSWKASSYIHFLESKGFIKDGKIVNL